MPGHLLDLNIYELSRLQGSEAHLDVDNVKIYFILGSGLLVTLDEICFPGCCPLRRPGETGRA